MEKSTPHDHLGASPDYRVIESARRRIACVSRCPTVCNRIVSAASVRITRRANSRSSPDDHFASRPHGCVFVSDIGRVGGAGRHPTIYTGLVSPTGVGKNKPVKCSTPYNHFAATPNCGVARSPSRGICDAGGYPAICPRIVSPAAGGIAAIPSTPHNHFIPCPDCCVKVSPTGGVCRGRGRPSISVGIVFTPSVETVAGAICSTPDDDFTAGPDSGVQRSSGRRIDNAGGCPTVGGWIVSPARVQRKIISLPVQTALWLLRLPGGLVGAQLSVSRLNLPPVFRELPS